MFFTAISHLRSKMASINNTSDEKPEQKQNEDEHILKLIRKKNSQDNDTQDGGTDKEKQTTETSSVYKRQPEKNKKTEILAGLMPAGCDPNSIRTGHLEYNTLWASNDVKTGPIMVNVVNAPNASTLQCGCENINCIFCNQMLSIEQTDPSVLK